MLTVRMLGKISIQQGSLSIVLQSRPAQSLLAWLMLTAGEAHRREKLAGILWPNARDENARDYLRHELWRLNRALRPIEAAGLPFLLVNKISITFNAKAPYWLDAHQMMLASAQPAATVEDELTSAFLYQGELLPGIYDDCVNPHRMRVLSAFDTLMTRLLRRLREERRYEDAVRAGLHWIMHGELPETAYRELMLAHHGLHDLAAIRRDMDACRSHLHSQLGARPSRKTLELFHRLMTEQQGAP